MIVVLMGVCGCGKTTTGEALASELGWPFLDSDAFHPEANVEKMVKVYKAPIDAKDVPQIVDYLVATNERMTPSAR